jgi:predicted Rossmann fold nucleotide-binding protein DprA/Smf involved in DNA uptake
MKKFQEQLAWISQTLAGLSKQVSRITKQVGKLPSTVREKPRRTPAKKAPGRAARVRKDTVLDSVLNAIKRSRKGISIAELKKKTALEDRQLSNALYKLTKKGMVQAKSRGIYVQR